VNNYLGRDEVRFNWFCAQRTKPLAPYQDLIKNYDPAGKDAIYDRQTIDEYFSEEEANELENYLTRVHRTRLYLEEIELPSEGGLLPLKSVPAEGLRDFYQLQQEEGYPLKIPVWGFYTLEGCPETKDLLKGTREEANGVLFIQQALKALNLPSSFEKAFLEDVVRFLFHAEGLLVVKNDDKK
jgi:hypothetical protein